MKVCLKLYRETTGGIFYAEILLNLGKNIRDEISRVIIRAICRRARTTVIA